MVRIYCEEYTENSNSKIQNYGSDQEQQNKLNHAEADSPSGLCRSLSVVLKVIQDSKRENQSEGWKCQWSGASQTLPPIRRGQEK
jgi:hypothetical protein